MARRLINLVAELNPTVESSGENRELSDIRSKDPTRRAAPKSRGYSRVQPQGVTDSLLICRAKDLDRVLVFIHVQSRFVNKPKERSRRQHQETTNQKRTTR
jgi:hypothetical protein